MSNLLRLGLVQFTPVSWDVNGNWDRLKNLLGNCGGQLDVVVTPECIVDGYAVREAPGDPAFKWEQRERWLRECALDPSKSEILAEAGTLSRRIGSYLVLGYTKLVGPGKAANAAAVFDRRGRMVATCHKTHLQEHDLQFQPGGSWTIVDADFGRFSILICADRRWPEAVRCQRVLGAKLVAIPSYGMHGELNLAMMRTRAYENGFFIAFAHPKQSIVAGPGGEVEANIRSTGDALVRCTVDLQRVNDSHIRARRIDLYKCLVTEAISMGP